MGPGVFGDGLTAGRILVGGAADERLDFAVLPVGATACVAFDAQHRICSPPRRDAGVAAIEEHTSRIREGESPMRFTYLMMLALALIISPFARGAAEDDTVALRIRFGMKDADGTDWSGKI